MSLPSLHTIRQKIIFSLKRFPLALVSALITVITAIYLVETSAAQAETYTFFYNIAWISLLGIPLFTALPLIAEYYNWSGKQSWGIQLAGILLLGVYYFSIPTELEMVPYEHIYRYILFFLGLHLLVAMGPYWKTNDTRSFWQYNRTLFLRFLTSVLFSGVLFIGLIIALLAVNILLEINIPDQSYFELFVIIGGIFNTWFFLAGIPESIHAFDHMADYPKGLKTFTQNILIPLVFIYLVILYIYMGKIIIQWTWPEGWIAILVLSFSIAGIFALLLLHPIRNDVETRWINKFSRIYYITLIPLIILLMLAIYRRVWEYGITIERYFVVVLGLWLAAIVVYFLASNVKNIKVIPGSLCILSFIISFGPWGTFSISEQNQTHRLQILLQQDSILEKGTIQRITTEIPFDHRKQISSIVRYLNDNHGLDELQPWFDHDLSHLEKHAADGDSMVAVNHYEKPSYILELMGIEYIDAGQGRFLNKSSTQNFYVRTNSQNAYSIENARWFIKDLSWSLQNDTDEFTLGDQKLVIQSKQDTAQIQIYYAQQKANGLIMNMDEICKKLQASYPDGADNLPTKKLAFDVSQGTINAKIYFKHINWEDGPEGIKAVNASFSLAIK